MSFPISALDKGLVAWKAPLPRLLLLLLPFPGSWALSKAHHLQSVAGQTLSLRCQYPPKGGPYERKGWCKEVSALLCTGLVTSSRPHMLTQASRFSIWDNPSSGFFVVTMTALREEDSGHYWCRIYPTSGRSVSKSVRFHLAVSPAPAPTQATQAPHSLVSSPTQSCASSTGRAGEPTGASSAITAPSRQENSTCWSSPAAASALVPLIYGFLVTKSLVLSALLVQVLRNRLVQCRRKSGMRPAPPRPQASGRFLLSLRTQPGQPVSPKASGAPPSPLSSEFPAEGEASLNLIQDPGCPTRAPGLRISQAAPPPKVPAH